MLRTTFLLFCLSTLLVGAAQNIGIGTTAPASSLTLHVHNNVSNDVSMGITNASTGVADLRGIRMRLNGTSFFLDNQEAGGNLQFGTGFTTRMFISPTGNVGIGTATPHTTGLLHVDAGTNMQQGLLVTGNLDNAATVPDLGAGSRLMFYPGKAAFRAGYSSGTEWDNSNVGLYSVGLGRQGTASGIGSLTLGAGRASGNSAVAINNTTASGQGAVSMGLSTTASGDYATAMGYFTKASGIFATTMGADGVASGYASTVMGEECGAKSYGTVAMGKGTIAQGWYSTAMGYRTNAKGFATTVAGMYNDSLLLSSDGSTVFPESPLFVVGNGNEVNDRSNAFVVRKDGNVGVGNIQPGYRLDVAGRMRLRGGGDNFSTAGIWLNNVGNTASNAFVGVYDDNNFGFYGNTGAGWGLTMNTTSGNVGIGTVSPTQKLQVIGNICATGTIGACSDIRYKTSILPVAHALSAVLQLHPIFYHWKKELNDAGFTGARQIGFSAQEIEAFFPEMVQTDANGYKAVDYSRMTAVLVQAVKEQQAEIEKLKEAQATALQWLHCLQKEWNTLKKTRKAAKHPQKK